MGSCLSKKKKKQSTPTEPLNDPQKLQKTLNEKIKKTVVHEEAAAVEKKPVFVVVNNGARKSTGGGDGGERKKGQIPAKKKYDKEVESGGAATPTGGGDGAGGGNVVVPVVAEEFKPAPVRISSCTKEEVDAILIQCGRLSRSSSGKAASGESGAGHRRYSGSKRSYDFDSEKKGENEEEEWAGRPVNRPSPQRPAPSRARSGSRERGSGGGRRVSRSPGRRSEAPSSSGGTITASERSRQPAKMVSVPAREKTRGVSPGAGANKRGGEMAVARNASPRQSRSPARSTRTKNETALNQIPPPPTNQPQSLGRSSPRKAEQSPCRRNPMAEIDENSLRAHNKAGNVSKVQKIGEDNLRKASQIQTQRAGENLAQVHKSEQKSGSENSIKEQLQISSKTEEDNNHEAETTEEAIKNGSSNGSQVLNAGSERLGVRGHSRTNSFIRSSRDFDNLLNPTSYTSLLLDDIHNLQQQQQHQNMAFSLPACVSKACSILDAVADLNSASSENKSSEGGRPNNGHGLLSPRYGMIRGFPLQKETFIESEIVMKDDLLEPSFHKYVTVRDLGVGDFEPQESAGSNSFVGQPWSSPWEPTSVDSSDLYGTSKSNNGEEVEQETEFSPLEGRNEQQPSAGNSCESGTRGRRSRGVSSSNFMAPTTSSDRKRELHHHSHLQRASSGATVGSGRSGGRA